jgi:hypothetical protein
MKKHTLPMLAALALVTGLLSGCGGSNDVAVIDPTPPAPASVPSTIGDSVDALIAFVKGLVNDDSAEPLLLGTVQPAISDTAEPTGL